MFEFEIARKGNESHSCFSGQDPLDLCDKSSLYIRLEYVSYREGTAFKNPHHPSNFFILNHKPPFAFTVTLVTQVGSSSNPSCPAPFHSHSNLPTSPAMNADISLFANFSPIHVRGPCPNELLEYGFLAPPSQSILPVSALIQRSGLNCKASSPQSFLERFRAQGLVEIIMPTGIEWPMMVVPRLWTCRRTCGTGVPSRTASWITAVRYVMPSMRMASTGVSLSGEGSFERISALSLTCISGWRERW